jgi:hypothetical protein
MLNNQHSQPLRCHTNESPDMPVRFKELTPDVKIVDRVEYVRHPHRVIFAEV